MISNPVDVEEARRLARDDEFNFKRVVGIFEKLIMSIAEK
mgnify:CR=1 FL=1